MKSPKSERPITWDDPRWPLVALKPPGDGRVASQEKFILRLPEGMRDRIKRAAERNKRSMNTELIYALEALYPPEPDIYDVIDSIHNAIRQANNTDGLPYRQNLVDALDRLSERLTSGIETDQFRAPHIGPSYDRPSAFLHRMDRWRRVQETGVETADLKREIDRGLFRNARGDTVRNAIEYLRKGKPERALPLFRLHEIKFADPPAAFELIEADLLAHYEENWGSLDDTPPWEEDDE